MRQTPARQLLDGWDSVRGEGLVMRAAALAAISRAASLADAVRWSIPRRDLALFELRAHLFGDALQAVASCPSCTEPLEMQLSLSQLHPTSALSGEDTDEREVTIDGVVVRWRMPNSEDLLAIAAAGAVDGARRALLERCVGASDPVLLARVAAALPAEPTDVELNLLCPACGHAWQVPFDIAAFVWTEVDGWARRTLQEVHIIAGAYGWTEDDILALSARRRATYVEMIQ